METDGKSERLVFPDPSEFPNLPTYGKWLPIACRDVVALTHYSDHYEGPCPPHLTVGSRGPYFFRNHPINYVMVTGKCVGFTSSYYKDSGSYSYEYTIDDHTGGLLIVKESSRVKDDSKEEKYVVGKYYQVHGYIGMFHRMNMVRARDIRLVRESRMSPGRSVFELFLEASAEALKVRKELLCKRHQPNEMYNSQLPASSDPVLYASFSRPRSIFQGSQLFQLSILDDYTEQCEELVQVPSTPSLEENVVEDEPEVLSEAHNRVGEPLAYEYDDRTKSLKVQVSSKASFTLSGYDMAVIVDKPESQVSVVEDTQLDSETKDHVMPISRDLSICISNRGKTSLQRLGKHSPDHLTEYRRDYNVEETDGDGSANSMNRKVDPFMETILRALPPPKIAYKVDTRVAGSNPKDGKLHKINKIKKSGRKMAPASKTKTLPLPLECIGFENIVREKFQNYTASQVLKTLGSQEKEIAPAGELIAAGSEYLAAAMRNGTKDVRIILDYTEPLFSEFFNHLVVDSVKHKRGWTPLLKQVALDTQFFHRVHRFTRHGKPNLRSLLEDPGSELFDPITLNTLEMALKMGKDIAVIRGDLVKVDGELVVATPEMFYPLVRRAFFKPNGERHKRRTMEEVIAQVTAEFEYASIDLITMAARKFVFDTGLTIDSI